MRLQGGARPSSTPVIPPLQVGVRSVTLNLFLWIKEKRKDTMLEEYLVSLKIRPFGLSSIDEMADQSIVKFSCKKILLQSLSVFSHRLTNKLYT